MFTASDVQIMEKLVAKVTAQGGRNSRNSTAPQRADHQRRRLREE